MQIFSQNFFNQNIKSVTWRMSVINGQLPGIEPSIDEFHSCGRNVTVRNRISAQPIYKLNVYDGLCADMC